jgi:hypothetical protein
MYLYFFYNCPITRCRSVGWMWMRLFSADSCNWQHCRDKYTRWKNHRCTESVKSESVIGNRWILKRTFLFGVLKFREDRER